MKTPCPDSHATLQFGSGDYYIFCHACGRRWGVLSNEPGADRVDALSQSPQFYAGGLRYKDPDKP